MKLSFINKSSSRDVAQRTGRNTEDVVRGANNSFLQHEIAFVEAVEKGLKNRCGSKTTGRDTTFRNPSGYSNGNTFDFEGRQLSSEHGGRRALTIIADKFESKPLNSRTTCLS